jgi:hypothetical protein
MSSGQKTIFVLGDQVTDCILTSKNEYLDPNRSLNDDSSNRESVTIYESRGGVHTLSGIVSKLSDAFTFFENKTFANGSDTISQWTKKGDGLFLVNQFGVLKKGGVPTTASSQVYPEDIDNLKKSNIIVVYNISDKNTYNELTSDPNNFNACELMLLRTKLCENGQLTEFAKKLDVHSGLLSKTILLLTATNLRQGGFNIQKGVSWEQLVTETINSLKKIEKHNIFEAIIVCFANEGCLIYHGKCGKATLFFYPHEIEGDHSLKSGKRVFASTITMQVAIAYALAHITSDKDKKKELANGVKSGLRAMKYLVDIGYTPEGAYPYTQIADKIKEYYTNINESNEAKYYPSNTDIDCCLNNDGQKKFNIVYTEVTKSGGHVDPNVKWFNACKEIVTTGKTENVNIPYLRYKKLITYDRSEIEALRNTYHLFRSYIDSERIDKPLSICVFGPPGSGKSFAVEQIISSIGEAKDKRIFKFNLSQMKEDELANIFHQIRDAGLKKKLPIVFFDEFDSTTAEKGQLGWIKYFLAPMQDGEFLDDKGHTHVIGRAIFIFAGGTYHCMNELKNAKEIADDKTKKVPDFLSRLKGYIDISGPNSRDKSNDVFGYKLRRATLLRSLLENKLDIQQNDDIQQKDDEKNAIRIADNLLRAFLDVDEYLYGARSLEAIVQTSYVTPLVIFSAPHINVASLAMHVSKDDFMKNLETG